MRLSTSAAMLISASAATAQDLALGAKELTHLRATIDAWTPPAPTVVIAVVDGEEPVILCRGTDTGGKPVAPLTYTPIGSLARLLVADALHVKLEGKLDVAAGVTVGSMQPTVLELLQGSDALPDYWDWRSDSKTQSVAALLSCADVAADAGFKFDWGPAGVAELMLLEKLFLGENADDWRPFLRVTLAPRVSGLDPRDAADDLAEGKGTSISLSSTIAQRARPAALRLMVTAKDLANWWQWRLRAPMPLWEGFRMGHRGEVPRRDGITVWRFEDFGTTPVKSLAITYPQHRSGILCVSVGPPKWVPGRDSALAAGFEADLFGPLGDVAAPMFGGRAGRDARPPLAALKGKRWTSGAGALQPCKIWIENATHQGVRLEFDGKTATSGQVLPSGAFMRVNMHFDQDHGGVLWLCPKPSMKDPKRLVAVFVERDELCRVPYLLELTLEDQTPR